MPPSIWVDHDGRNISLAGCARAIPLTEDFLASICSGYEFFPDEGSHRAAVITFRESEDAQKIYQKLVRYLERAGYDVNSLVIGDFFLTPHAQANTTIH